MESKSQNQIKFFIIIVYHFALIKLSINKFYLKSIIFKLYQFIN